MRGFAAIEIAHWGNDSAAAIDNGDLVIKMKEMVVRFFKVLES